MNEREASQVDLVPRPDPTLLTTQQLDRGLEGLEKLLNVRIDALERALSKVQAERDQFPTRIDEKISAMAAVHTERFHSVGETVREAKAAVDAAFLAAKESVSKSEAMTTKIIDQQSALISSETAGLKGQISDIKERLTRIEGTGAGRDNARDDSRANGHLAIAIIGTIIGAAGILAAILM